MAASSRPHDNMYSTRFMDAKSTESRHYHRIWSRPTAVISHIDRA